MNHLRLLGCLVRDTFRHAFASGIAWLMLAVCGLCILFALSVSIEGGETLRDFLPVGDPAAAPQQIQTSGVQLIQGHLSLGWGVYQVPLWRSDVEAVHWLQVLLARWVAGTIGVLLALLWTAGFLPAFLLPANVTVLLTKPSPRWLLLAGKVLGVAMCVAIYLGILVCGTWAALGLRTGVWTPAYLAAWPIALAQFLVIYGFCALLAVCTRSTVACVFGGVLFWLACFGMNYARHATVALPNLDRTVAAPGPVTRGLVETGYWLLPKPADLSLLLDRAVMAEKHFPPPPEYRWVWKTGELNPALSVLTSLASAAVFVVLAGIHWRRTDY